MLRNTLRYEPIKWDFCFICQNKTFKKDFKVHTSTKDGHRFIPVHEIINSLNPVFCQILPAAHALSGCDTTSSMFGIGKRTVYKVGQACFFFCCKLNSEFIEIRVICSSFGFLVIQKQPKNPLCYPLLIAQNH
jgi:hypothetical protein